ncbi:MAG: PEP-CTERM sorting domain-containing protein [Planctomycetota bacterium]
MKYSIYAIVALASTPVMAGTLSTTATTSGGIQVAPPFVPPSPGLFNAGIFMLIGDQPVELQLNAVSSGTDEAYSVLFVGLNNGDSINAVTIDIEGPGRFGGSFSPAVNPTGGTADVLSDQSAYFDLDDPWLGSGGSAAFNFELIVEDPVGSSDLTITFSPVPEPGSAALFGLGCLVIGRRTTRARRPH